MHIYSRILLSGLFVLSWSVKSQTSNELFIRGGVMSTEGTLPLAGDNYPFSVIRDYESAIMWKGELGYNRWLWRYPRWSFGAFVKMGAWQSAFPLITRDSDGVATEEVYALTGFAGSIGPSVEYAIRRYQLDRSYWSFRLEMPVGFLISEVWPYVNDGAGNMVRLANSKQYFDVDLPLGFFPHLDAGYHWKNSRISLGVQLNNGFYLSDGTGFGMVMGYAVDF